MKMNPLQDIINQNRAWYCLECGKCSAVCPITAWETRSFCSPRLLIEKALNGHSADIYEDPLFWSCLTCKRCSELCPSDVLFSEFIRDARRMANSNGLSGECTHGNVIQTWSQMMTASDFDPNRLTWLDDDLSVSQDSEILYFVGCLPYYHAQFKHLGIEGLEIARAAVRILNHLGIEPQLLADELCCGHDQIWQGDLSTFEALARRNLERFKASGARQIITTCPECARTLKLDYPQRVGDHGMEVLHLTQFIRRHSAARMPGAGAANKKLKVTYQDACRLGRHLGVYEEPRTLLQTAGIELVEMQRTRRRSLCCGTSCWTACGKVSKNIQVERLKEARATGAEMLVTSCVKCQIHLKCAQQDPHLENDIAIPIRDLTTVLAERL